MGARDLLVTCLHIALHPFTDCAISPAPLGTLPRRAAWLSLTMKGIKNKQLSTSFITENSKGPQAGHLA